MKRKAENRGQERTKCLKNKIAKRNLEHLESIRKSLEKTKSVQIFDSLYEYGGLSTDMLGDLVIQNTGSHAFHYSFKELKDKGIVVAQVDPDNPKVTPKIFVLADKVFLNPDDRPKKDDIDIIKLSKDIFEGWKKKEERKKKKTKNKIQVAFTAAEEISEETAGIAREAAATAVAEIYEKVIASVASATARAAAINVNDDKVNKVLALLVAASCATATAAAITDVSAAAAEQASDAVEAAQQAVELYQD